MNSNTALIVVLISAYVAGTLHLQHQNQAGQNAVHPPTRRPIATLLMVFAIALPTTLQFAFPTLLTVLERNTTRIVAGEWWRIITPLFVQDGGVSGSIFNLVSLLAIGQVAERLWGSRRWLMIFFTCGIVSEIIALAWQPVGAGNSVANFGLAMSSVVLCIVESGSWSVRIVATIALLASTVLLLRRDIHGAAALLGVVIGLAFLAYDRHAAADTGN